MCTSSENKNLTIREFASSDVDMIFNFFETLSETTRYFILGLPKTYEETEKLVKEDMENSDALRYLAFIVEDGQQLMVGYVFFWAWSKKIPWFGIAVRDGYQGKHIGEKLMDHAISIAKESMKGGILLTTKKDNIRAQSLYKKKNFEIMGEHTSGETLMLLTF